MFLLIINSLIRLNFFNVFLLLLQLIFVFLTRNISPENGLQLDSSLMLFVLLSLIFNVFHLFLLIAFFIMCFSVSILDLLLIKIQFTTIVKFFLFLFIIVYRLFTDRFFFISKDLIVN